MRYRLASFRRSAVHPSPARSPQRVRRLALEASVPQPLRVIMTEPTEPLALHPAQQGELPEKPVAVTLTRWDLVRLNVSLMARIRSTWMLLVVMTLAAGLLHTTIGGLPSTSRAWLVMGLAAAMAAGIGSAAGLVVAVFLVLFCPDPDTTLGRKTYRFEADGLRERTSNNDTIIRWGGVRDVRRIGNFILINVAPGLYHALPRRSFSSPREYQAFWRAAQKLTGAVHSALG
jgi:YcxB-like protein